MTIDANRVLQQVGDTGAALALFFARAYAFWALWLLAAPALPLWDHVYRLDVLEVCAVFGAIAVWRGLSWPSAGSWRAALTSAALYAAVGLTGAWVQGEAPEVTTSLDSFELP